MSIMKVGGWILSLLVSLGLTARGAEVKPTDPAESSEKVKNVGVAEFEQLRTDPKNAVLDVRTPREFTAGRIAGAVNLDFNGSDFEQQVAKLDKTKVYLVYCASGRRSASACEKMSRLKFPKLYNLEGGFRAWERAGHKAVK